jgi:hypothetical protein
MTGGLLLVLAMASAVTAGDDEPERVFFAQLAGGDATTEQEVSLLQDAVLVSARKHAGNYVVLAVSDVRDMLEAEAQAAVSGCDAVSCASEIADALNAPQLVTGQVGRVGNTWLLTLTRTDRDSLEVLAREQVQRKGDEADVLLPAIDNTVARLFGATPEPSISPAVWAGAAALGVGAVITGVGGALHAASFVVFEDQFVNDKETGETVVGLSVVSYVAGGVVLLVGGGVLVAGLLGLGGQE